MARYGSDQVAFFLVGGRNLVGALTTFSVRVFTNLKTLTPLGTAAKVQTPTGVSRGELTQSGWYDDSVGGSHEALVGATGRSNQVVCLGVAENVTGRAMWGMAGALVATYDRGAAVDDFQKADATYEINGAVDETAKIIAPLTARGASGNTQGTSVDNGASSAAGGAGYLQVSAITLGGYTSVTFKVRHSVDNGTYTDLITFANVTAAPTAERLTVAGTVNRYLAMSWLWNGSGSSQSVSALVGFARN